MGTAALLTSSPLQRRHWHLREAFDPFWCAHLRFLQPAPQSRRHHVPAPPSRHARFHAFRRAKMAASLCEHCRWHQLVRGSFPRASLPRVSGLHHRRPPPLLHSPCLLFWDRPSMPAKDEILQLKTSVKISQQADLQMLVPGAHSCASCPLSGGLEPIVNPVGTRSSHVSISMQRPCLVITQKI